LNSARGTATGATSQLTLHSGEAVVAFRNWRDGAVPDQKPRVFQGMQIEGSMRHVEAQFVEV
jgi:hypothetical protein